MIQWALYRVLFVLLLLVNVLALVTVFTLLSALPPGVSCEAVTGMHTSKDVLTHLADGFMRHKLPPPPIHQLVDRITAILTYFRPPPLSANFQPALDAARKYTSMVSHIVGTFPKVWLEGARGAILGYQVIRQTCWRWLGALNGLLLEVFESALKYVSTAASWTSSIPSNLVRFLGDSAFSSRIVSFVRIAARLPLKSIMGLRVLITLIGVGIFRLLARLFPWVVKLVPTRVSERMKTTDAELPWEGIDNWRTECQESRDADTGEIDEDVFPGDAWVTPRTRQSRQVEKFDQKPADAQEMGGVTKWLGNGPERFVWFTLGGLVVWVVRRELELRDCRSRL